MLGASHDLRQEGGKGQVLVILERSGGVELGLLCCQQFGLQVVSGWRGRWIWLLLCGWCRLRLLGGRGGCVRAGLGLQPGLEEVPLSAYGLLRERIRFPPIPSVLSRFRPAPVPADLLFTLARLLLDLLDQALDSGRDRRQRDAEALKRK